MIADAGGLLRQSKMFKIKTAPLVGLIGILAVLSADFLARNIDFRVYYEGVGGYLRGIRPLYGPFSGIEYPQEFRYPPNTVIFFFPLTLLPLRIASICWIVMAWAACAWAAALAIRKWKLVFTVTGVLLGLLLLVPYIVLAVKFGNVQPHLIALVLLALLWSDTHPSWSGLALALAICFKIWPLFFAPWFLLPRRRSTLVYTASFTVLLWTVPVFFFGWSRYWTLMEDFFVNVISLASGPEEVWYSSQSLRGVLMRLLTDTVPPRDGYPDMSFASLPASVVGGCCILVSILIYGYVVWAMWRSTDSQRYLWDAAAFVFFSLLQPFCLNSSLISLLPAILAAAHVYSSPPGQFPAAAKRWFLVTCGVSIIASATFYRPLQRSALMLGVDFWLMVALSVSLVLAARRCPITHRTLPQFPC